MTAIEVTTDRMAPEALQRHADELLKRDQWPRERLDALTSARLKRLLDDVAQRSPYYRDVLGPNASEADLSDLPTLPKSVLMERFDEIVTDSRLRRR